MKKYEQPVDWFGIVIVMFFIATLTVLFHRLSTEHPIGEWQCTNWTETKIPVETLQSGKHYLLTDGTLFEFNRTCNQETFMREPE